MGFTGIPAEGIEFYERLDADNNKAFWQANRATFDEHVRGPMVELCGALARRYSIGAIDELKTAPRGVAKDHPRIALMRRKGLMMSKDFAAPAWVHTKRAVGKVREVWEASEPMCAWLDRHVGPSTLPPPDFG